MVESRADLPPVIGVAPNDWETPWSGRQQLLSRLAARGWPVIYSVGPMSTWERGSDRWRRSRPMTRFRYVDGVWLDTPGRLSAYWPGSPRWASLALRRHARQLARFAARWPTTPPLLLLFHPRFVDYAELIPHKGLVYHAYDAFSGTPGWTAEMASREGRLAALADRVFAVSSEVGRKLAHPGPDKFSELPSAVDSSAFAAGPSLPCPADLAAVAAPRIGYVGRISTKIDTPFLRELVLARPAYQWVFIGPETFGREGSDERAAFEQLKMLPNVHSLGQKSHHELPAYQGHMSVNILCYRTSPGWWVSCSPLKIYEYMATGVPVVSSQLAALDGLDSIMAMPERNVPAWLAALDAAVAGQGVGTVASRRAFSGANDWNQRVDRLETELLALCNRPAHRAA